MVIVEQSGYKIGGLDVSENGSYVALRPQFESILTPAQFLRKRFEELDALPKDRKWKKKDLGLLNMNRFCTSMGVAGATEELVLNPNSEALSAATSQTQLVAY